MSKEANRIRNSLLLERQGLVERCVNQFLGRKPWLRNQPGFDREDLVQIGMIKVLEVLDTVDIDTIDDLDAYLYSSVRYAILDAADELGNSLLTASRAKSVRRLLAVHGELEAKTGRPPETVDLARVLNCSVKVVERLLRDRANYGPLRSLDAPLNDGEGATLHELVPGYTCVGEGTNGHTSPEGLAQTEPRKRMTKPLVEVTVRTMHGAKHPSFRRLGPATKKVLCYGVPYTWAVKKIFWRAPNVGTIQVEPRYEGSLTPDLLEEISEKGVTLVYSSVSFSWRPRTGLSVVYEAKREFLLNLNDQQRDQFQKMLQLDIVAAKMAARYYCLNGEDFVSQEAIGEEHGFSRTCSAYVSQQINAVLDSLGYRPSNLQSKGSKEYAGRIHVQIWKTRKARERERLWEEQTALRSRIGKELGLPPLAEKFPLKRLPTLKQLVQANQQGKLEQLKQTHRRSWLSISVRFGFDDREKGVYRTLQEVANSMGVTRQRAHQLEVRGLELLGIRSN